MTSIPQNPADDKLAADAKRHEERERLRMPCQEFGF